METPKVAVIIPVKNRAALLAITLKNILAQSLPPAEVLVIDDGSTDHLAEVIQSFGGAVKCVANTGKGPGAARNLGMRLTQSPFIQFFDSDDLMTRGKIEVQVNALVQADADMAYGPYVQAIEASNGQWRQVDVIMQAYALPDQNLLTWMLRGWNAITQSMLFRRSFLEKCPSWDEHLITHEDYLYISQLAAHQPTIVHIPNEAVLYRQHGGQSTANHTIVSSRALDKWEVMNQLLGGGISRHTDSFTQLMFKGRYNQTTDFATTQGIQIENVAKFSIFSILLYRLYNKFERLKTGSNWETMHGIDKRPEAFARIVSQLV